MTASALPSQEELARLFSYDHLSGTLLWRERDDVPPRIRKRFAGKAAGHTNKRGYVQVSIFGRLRYAHRIIWKMKHGTEPDVLDHIDGNTANNRLSNLRAATQAQNLANRRRSADRALPRGVYMTPAGRFKAEISAHSREKKYIGTFATVDEASAAYQAAAKAEFGEFARVE